MTFKDYLQRPGIDNSTPGSEAIVYAVIAACKPEITYREASLVFADVPVIRETFELLWNEYEDILDLMRPIEGSEIDAEGILLNKMQRARHSEPEHVAVITGRVLKKISGQDKETEHETKQND